ncbi:hypothetical protein [Flexivirga alba]|uniref:DUF3987 domain-containing protein n=1 Tax=Flexivirga alba TaxID=702742 RepID=A0ABW2AKZ7_9MICO
MPDGVDPVTGEVTDDYYQPDNPAAIDRGDLVDLEHKAAALTASKQARDAPERAPAFDLERDDFWTARTELERLRQFARARFASPWATLGVALARVIVHIQPNYVLPPTIGGDASLNLFVGIVAPSGSGKGAADSVSKAAIRFPAVDQVDEMPVGSGEGLAHAYVHYVPGKGKEKGGIEQHATRALFSVHEVDTLTALKGRQGSTLLPQLRSAWMGERLGFQNADPTRRLNLRPHSYRLCLTVGIQPTRADVLLDDADGGTPQRFLWMPGTDPNVPDDDQQPPEQIQWRPPDTQGHAINYDTGHYAIPVCDQAITAIKAAARARMRGDVEALDGHALLCRLKTAAALGFLDRRAEVTEQDWQLAGIVMEISNHTRAGIQQQLTATHRDNTKARGRTEGLRQLAAEEVRTEVATKRISRAILSKTGTDWTPRSALRKTLPGRDREHFDGAIDRLLTAGLIDCEDLEYNGAKGARYRRAGGTS